MISVTNPALAQTCEYAKDEQGKIPNMIIIDGKVYYYHSVEKARQIAKDKVKLQSSEKVADANKIIIEGQKEIITQQNGTIVFMETARRQDREILMKSLEKPRTKWYNNGTVAFIGGVVFATTMYGFWVWADSKR